MKIGIIGANGKAGALIADEAVRRGHEVTAIVRDKEKLKGKSYAYVLEKDLYDLKPEDVSVLDAVVSAFGLPFGAPHPDNVYKDAIRKLIEVFEQIPDVRLLIVGGAASLYTDPHKKHRFLEQIPEDWRKAPADMAEGFKLLQDSKAKWTYFSPAFTFDFKGAATGKYTLGGDFAITNASNESYISYADYATAMVDEVENAFHVRRRFTAVSDGKPAGAAGAAGASATPASAPDAPGPEGYFGIFKKEPQFEGLSQYRAPFNFELAGKEYKLVMNQEKDFFVRFADGHSLEWSQIGGAPTREYYECAKTDELTFFVNFELAGVKPRTNITLVLDLEQRLVTVVRSVTNFNEKYPYLIKSEFDFGALDLPGFPLPFARHGYTTDLVGKRIHWHYSPKFDIVHVYYNPYYMRVTFTPERMARMAATAPPPGEDSDFRRYPYDEPTVYIKIKEGIYLVSCIETNMSRRGLTGNSLLFLEDLKRMHDVGRSFGHAGLREGNVHGENYLFSAFGEFVKSDEEEDSRKNAWIV